MRARAVYTWRILTAGRIVQLKECNRRSKCRDMKDDASKASAAKLIPEEQAIEIRRLAHDLSNALEIIVQTSYLLSMAELKEPASDWLRMLDSGVNKALDFEFAVAGVCESAYAAVAKNRPGRYTPPPTPPFNSTVDSKRVELGISR